MLDQFPLILPPVKIKFVALKISLTLCFVSFVLYSCGSGEGKQKIKTDTVRHQAIPTPTLSEPEKKKYHDAVEDFFDHNHFLQKFNGGILIAKNGVPVYELYKGFTDVREKDSVTAETPLQIASTSKPFTAAAVLQLVQQGKIGLDDPVSKYFPGFPYPAVIVRSLLNHRSGLPNYLYYMEDKKYGWDRKKLATNADVLQSLMTWNVPQSYRPNVHFSYCNTNFVLLALLIEKVTGVPFPQYMQQNFFDRYGMTHTHIVLPTDSSAIQSLDRFGRVWAKDFSDGPYGDKNVYSTPRDLLKWDQAWYNGQVLNQQWTDSAFTGYSNERPSMHNYGLGWRLLTTPTKKKVIYHNGHWHGFNSGFARLVEEKATIIILSNKFNPSVYPVARALYNVFGNYDGKHEEEEE